MTDNQPAATPTPAPEAAALLGGGIPEAAAITSSSTLTEYFRNWLVRVRAGDTGALPVIAGLILLAVIFQSLNGNFLTAGNLVNLMVQGSVYMLFALGMIFILLLGEIDLSIGFIGGVAGVVMALLTFGNSGLPWYVGVAAGLLCSIGIGLLNGVIITAIGLPSFIVTLAGLLAWNGVMLIILGNGGTIPINDETINNLANGLLDPIVSWIVLAVMLALYIADQVLSARARKHSGVPRSVTILKIAGVIVAGLIVVAICNTNRGRVSPIEGVPWVLLIVFFFATLWTVVQQRTRFGTYIYAIGGNAEAARRAGIAVNRIRIAGFTIAGFMGGVAGIIYASRLRSVSTNLDGGQLVLYCIAAAVIGGTSLFGGRGKAISAILGGLVIASIDNGMGLLGLAAATRYVVTGIVLVVAVTIDALASRGRASSGLS
ncbi:MAG TPA: sugar ABC transporter permease [Devosia sp.]|nr:sugar ABC transporter permease [Devosia sp.]